MAESNQSIEITMDPNDLYREETISDRGPGSIRQMIPIKPDGSPDKGRATLYVGQAQLMTPAGALPLSFQIEANSLKEAVKQFPDAAQQAVNEAIQELNELRRESASQIMVPGQESGGGFGGGMGGLGGGGAGGGGIQIR